jgi:RHS repeat-associated protein
MASEFSTTTVVDDPLNEAADVMAAKQSSPDILAKLERVVGLYLKRQAFWQRSVDHQRELEKLLGSVWSREIEMVLNAHEKGRAQFCADEAPRPHSEADPVEMFNGQFVYTATDLRISGAGIDFVLSRTYKNQAFTRGRLGYNWDHSYNYVLREVGTTLVLSSGELREDRYVRHETHGFYLPPDGIHSTIAATGRSFTLRTQNATRFIYERDGQTEHHRLRRIQDRNTNYLGFEYDDRGRLAVVEVNAPARTVRFRYDLQDRLIAITAYPVTYRGRAGRRLVQREWRYHYDDFGDLVAVTGPATEEHPHGLTTRYEYSSGVHSGELAHNLLRIYDPAGHLFVENEYGVQDGVITYNRVTRQRQGAGEYRFEYERIEPETSWNYTAEERPASRTILYFRNGHAVEHVYNALGSLVVRRERVRERCRSRDFIWRYRYNRDGALVASLSPSGSLTQFLYGREDFYARRLAAGNEGVDPWQDPTLTASERRRFGNQLAVVKRGLPYSEEMFDLARGLYGDIFPTVFAAAENDIIVKSTYEPFAQQLAVVSDPRYTASPDPRHPESSAYRSHLTRHEYSRPPRVNLLRVRYPDTTFPSPLSDGTAGLVDTTTDYLRYDRQGRPLRIRDGAGSVTRYSYFRRGVREGYLRRVVRDVGTLNLTTSYTVNEAGDTTAELNPRGARLRKTVNELGQIVGVTNELGFGTRAYYDRNGLMSRKERTNIDEADRQSSDGNEVRTFRYDAQNNLVRESIGGNDLSRHHVTQHHYDSSDLRVATVLPRGNRVEYVYDERLLPRATTRGAGSDGESTVYIVHDGDGRKVEVTDARGNITRFRYDSLNRLVAVVDPEGHVQQREYDELNNVTTERIFERAANGAYNLLTRRAYEYDERGSCIRELNYLFDSPIPTASPELDAGFAAALAFGSVTTVTTEFFYDRKKRLFRVLDERKAETVYEYDGADHRVSERDSLGNLTRNWHDANGNLVRVDRHEQVKDPQTGTIVREDVFSVVSEFDMLDRRVASIDGLGNRTTFTYDSRDHVTSVTDPLGNVRRFEFDVFGRRLRETAEMTVTGIGGDARLPDIVTSYIYDDNGNRIAITDARGIQTRFEFDPLDRLIHTIFPDSTTSSVAYDLDDNVSARVNNNGLRIVYEYDALKRLKSVRLDKTNVVLESPYPSGREEFEAFEYDGLGRTVLQRNDFCEVSLVYDSFGRARAESFMFTTASGGTVGPLTVQRAFEPKTNRAVLTYSNGRRVVYHFDAQRRLERVENLSYGINDPGSGAVPESHEIARYTYRGRRLERLTFGNAAGYELRYDGGGRVINIRNFSGAQTLLETQQLYDGVGNRRYQRDAPPSAGRLNGETYRYDSLYQLTHYAPTVLQAVNPLQYAPPAAPLTQDAFAGQQQIDIVIGSLAQDPLNFTYRYDALGNRVEERRVNQAAVAYITDVLNQYQSVDSRVLRYDRNGNLVDDGDRLYRYNYFDALSEVVDKVTGVGLLDIAYDARHRAIAVREAGSELHLIYDGPNVIEEYDAGVLAVQYVNENGVDRRVQTSQGGQDYWYHADLIRSTRLLTNAAGQEVARYDYGPFGSLITPVAHANRYAFAGKRSYVSGQLYDSRSRQYSAAFGRFLQRDPQGMLDGANLYTYAGNNPVNFVDLYGFAKDGAVATFDPWDFSQILTKEYWADFSRGTDWYLREYIPAAQAEWDQTAALLRQLYPAEQTRLRRESANRLDRKMHPSLVLEETEQHFVERHIGARPARIGIVWDLAKIYAPAAIIGAGSGAAAAQRSLYRSIKGPAQFEVLVPSFRGEAGLGKAEQVVQDAFAHGIKPRGGSGASQTMDNLVESINTSPRYAESGWVQSTQSIDRAMGYATSGGQRGGVIFEVLPRSQSVIVNESASANA